MYEKWGLGVACNLDVRLHVTGLAGLNKLVRTSTKKMYALFSLKCLTGRLPRSAFEADLILL